MTEERPGKDVGLLTPFAVNLSYVVYEITDAGRVAAAGPQGGVQAFTQ
jgi:hypothetical protein